MPYPLIAAPDKSAIMSRNSEGLKLSEYRHNVQVGDGAESSVVARYHQLDEFKLDTYATWVSRLRRGIPVSRLELHNMTPLARLPSIAMDKRFGCSGRK